MFVNFSNLNTITLATEATLIGINSFVHVLITLECSVLIGLAMSY